MEPKTKMTECEFCGREYKNVVVHQRFCKAKKEALEQLHDYNPEDEEKEKITKEAIPIEEVENEISDGEKKEIKKNELLEKETERLEKEAEEAKKAQEAVSKELESTPEGESGRELVELEEEITQEQVDLVTKSLEGTEALSTEDKKEEEPEIDDAMKEAMKNAGVVKVKDESLIREQKPTEEQKAMFKEELVIEFNEPQDSWETKLCDVFKQVDSGREVHIKLKGQLSHEFSVIDGVIRYPSSGFINVVRTYCSSFRDEVNAQGGQTFICKRK